jgi:hypothetical protein
MRVDLEAHIKSKMSLRAAVLITLFLSAACRSLQANGAATGKQNRGMDYFLLVRYMLVSHYKT